MAMRKIFESSHDELAEFMCKLAKNCEFLLDREISIQLLRITIGKSTRKTIAACIFTLFFYRQPYTAQLKLHKSNTISEIRSTVNNNNFRRL